MNYHKFLAIFFAVFLVNFQANAQAYFDKDIISPTLIDPPFKVDSAEWKSDVKEIIKIQKNVDVAEIDQALEERELVSEHVALVDPTLTRQQHPQLYKLLDRVSETSREVNRSAKNYWNTKRPYLMDKNIKALITPHDNPAYPSGHTSGSYVLAHVLGLLIPEKRAQFQERAAKIAWHRVMIGMHYPKDVDGGRQLALLVVGALMENPDFRKDFEKAKKELSNKVNK